MNAGAKKYMIISDLHLCDIEDYRDGWKRYKSSKYKFDNQFDKLIQDFVDKNTDQELILILNGDIIDFDLITVSPEDSPWTVSRREKKIGLSPTAEKSAWKLARVLNDHVKFVETLAKFLSFEKNKIVYIAGNHDMEIHFSDVQETFRDILSASADKQNIEINSFNLMFENWFYYVPNEIYIEHGQQYDHYSSFRYVLNPVVTISNQEHIALPMGNMANRQIMNQMGYFNPYSSDYLMSFFNYIVHWFKFYAFSRRSLWYKWFFGSFYVLFNLLRTKEKYRRPNNYDELLFQQAKKYNIPVQDVRSIEKLKRAPITDHVFRIIREFWLDRMVLATLMVLGTILLMFMPVGWPVKLLIPLTTFPTIYTIYDHLVSGITVAGEAKFLPKLAREIMRVLPVPVIVFGHTHLPQLVPLSRNRSFVNSGTWAPIFKEESRDTLVQGYRNYIEVQVTPRKRMKSRVQTSLGSWQS